jgi:methyl halide transferase
MASLLKPGGYLITLVFPIDPQVDVGPPYFVRVEHYAEVLGDNFIKVMDKVPGTSSQTHVGKERIVVWRRV